MAELKKVCFFSISLAKGGAENQLVKLALHLKQKGHSVCIIRALSQNDFKDKLEENNIETRLFKYNSPKGILEMLSFIKNNKPDVLVSFMFGANLAARTIKLKFGIPLITSVRTSNISRIYGLLYRGSYKLDNYTVFNSTTVMEDFIKKRLSLSNKSIFIPNAISIIEKEYQKTDPKIFTLISIAHFRPAKDYNTLFEAIKILKENGFRIKLFVLGKTFQQKWPEQMVKRLGIENEVEIKGFVSNPQRYLELADGLVLSSLWEGTPNAVLEAMANKMPVVASDIPACKELIENAQCGLLFSVKNAKDLSVKIQNLFNLSKKEREKLGKNGYHYVKKYYEESIVYERWENLIYSL